MKKHSLWGKLLFWGGYLFFMFGIAPITGAFQYSTFIPGQVTAIIYIGIGLIMVFLSNFLKKERV
ncbi:hypothetical protein [Bacillus cihuensis]|nr:hypothetical protein [Bacillus cihuensis]